MASNSWEVETVDSDEDEVFFGPITEKELLKDKKDCRRRTTIFHHRYSLTKFQEEEEKSNVLQDSMGNLFIGEALNDSANTSEVALSDEEKTFKELLPTSAVVRKISDESDVFQSCTSSTTSRYETASESISVKQKFLKSEISKYYDEYNNEYCNETTVNSSLTSETPITSFDEEKTFKDLLPSCAVVQKISEDDETSDSCEETVLTNEESTICKFLKSVEEEQLDKSLNETSELPTTICESPPQDEEKTFKNLLPSFASVRTISEDSETFQSNNLSATSCFETASDSFSKSIKKIETNEESRCESDLSDEEKIFQQSPSPSASTRNISSESCPSSATSRYATARETTSTIYTSLSSFYGNMVTVRKTNTTSDFQEFKDSNTSMELFEGSKSHLEESIVGNESIDSEICADSTSLEALVTENSHEIEEIKTNLSDNKSENYFSCKADEESIDGFLMERHDSVMSGRITDFTPNEIEFMRNSDFKFIDDTRDESDSFPISVTVESSEDLIPMGSDDSIYTANTISSIENQENYLSEDCSIPNSYDSDYSRSDTNNKVLNTTDKDCQTSFWYIAVDKQANCFIEPKPKMVDQFLVPIAPRKLTPIKTSEFKFPREIRKPINYKGSSENKSKRPQIQEKTPEKKIRQFNYNNVVSPVAKYIKGAPVVTPLISNVLSNSISTHQKKKPTLSKIPRIFQLPKPTVNRH